MKLGSYTTDVSAVKVSVQDENNKTVIEHKTMCNIKKVIIKSGQGINEIGSKMPSHPPNYHDDEKESYNKEMREQMPKILSSACGRFSEITGIKLWEIDETKFDNVDEHSGPQYIKYFLAHSYHTHYIRDKLKDNFEKFYEKREFEILGDLNTWIGCARLLLRSLRYHEHYRDRKSDFFSGPNFVIEAIRADMELRSSVGKIDRNSFNILTGHLSSEHFTSQAGFKMDYLDQVQMVFNYFFQGDGKDDLGVFLSYVNIPNKSTQKDEGIDCFGSKEKIRSITTMNIFSIVIQYPFYEKFKKMVLHNTPFFYGLAWDHGDANQITYQLFQRTKIFLREWGLPDSIDSETTDIKRYDFRQSFIYQKVTIYLMIGLFYPDFLENSNDELDEDQQRVKKLLEMVIDCDVTPIIDNITASKYIQTSEYLPSGSLGTSLINSIMSALMCYRSFQKFINRINLEKWDSFVRDDGTTYFNSKQEFDSFIMGYTELFISFPPFMVMGDNIVNCIPGFFRKFWYVSDDYSFKNGSLNQALEEFGFCYKPEETLITRDWRPSNYDIMTSEVHVNYSTEYSSDPSFCSRWFIQRRFPGRKNPFFLEGFHESPEHFMVPQRRLYTVISKLAPQSNFVPLPIYYIKCLSLYRDNCKANPYVEIFLKILLGKIKPCLNSEHNSVIQDLEYLRRTEPDEFVRIYGGVLKSGSRDNKSFFAQNSIHDLMNDNKAVVDLTACRNTINEAKCGKNFIPIQQVHLTGDDIEQVLSKYGDAEFVEKLKMSLKIYYNDIL